jgi:tetratricopeptide (TPR) repeat protein
MERHVGDEHNNRIARHQPIERLRCLSAPMNRGGAIRRFGLLIALLTFSGCASAKRPTVDAGAQGLERIAEADALVRAGCLDCLVAAFSDYDALRIVPAVSGVATDRAARTAVLVALRERELGLLDSGYLERARVLAAKAESIVPLVEIADTTPSRSAARQVDDAQLRRMQIASTHRDEWLEQLHEHIDSDPLSVYLWLGLSCAFRSPTRQAVNEWRAELASWHDVPLVSLKLATCGNVEAAALEQLLQTDGRFLEVHYYVAIRATLGGKLSQAAGQLQSAYAWRPRWPEVTNSLALVSLTAEEFDQALDFFDRTLAMVPAHPDALLGRIRALTYLGRYTDALIAADRLLAVGHWYVGDARYWRAFNEMSLGQNEEAWSDIEEASKLLINAEVPKLAGMIAYRRKQIDVSRAKFEESRERNPRDCETGFYLGVVLAELSAWIRTADVLVETGGCLEAVQRDLNGEIEQIRQSTDPPDRQQRRIAKREQQIATARRMLAQSWFNIAVAYYNVSRNDDAREYAEKVSTDDQFGERARQLLARMSKDQPV